MHAHADREKTPRTFSPRDDRAAPRARPVPGEPGLAREESFLRLDCYLCHERFVLDLEEQWSTDPEEMELIGREFLSVPRDASLCPRCFHEVELAGAERMYWARAQA